MEPKIKRRPTSLRNSGVAEFKIPVSTAKTTITPRKNFVTNVRCGTKSMSSSPSTISFSIYEEIGDENKSKKRPE